QDRSRRRLALWRRCTQRRPNTSSADSCDRDASGPERGRVRGVAMCRPEEAGSTHTRGAPVPPRADAATWPWLTVPRPLVEGKVWPWPARDREIGPRAETAPG